MGKREIKFRFWTGKEMISPDVLAFEEYVPLIHHLNQEGMLEYTGLKDKNKVEIFEGDILSSDWNDKWGVVTFKNGSFVLEFKTQQITKSIPLHSLEYIELQVIGNVYEHPELLY